MKYGEGVSEASITGKGLVGNRAARTEDHHQGHFHDGDRAASTEDHHQGHFRDGDRTACTEDHQGYFRDGDCAACTVDHQGYFHDGDRAARMVDHQGYFCDGDRAARTEDHHQGHFRDGDCAARTVDHQGYFRDGDRIVRLEGHHQGHFCDGNRVVCLEGHHPCLLRDGNRALQQQQQPSKNIHQQCDNIKWTRERGGKSGRRKRRRDYKYIFPDVPPKPRSPQLVTVSSSLGATAAAAAASSMVRAESNDGTVRYNRGDDGRGAQGAASSPPPARTEDQGLVCDGNRAARFEDHRDRAAHTVDQGLVRDGNRAARFKDHRHGLVHNEVDGSSKGGVPSASPSDNEVAQKGDSICNKVGPSGDDAMPIFRQNPDRAARSARGGKVASLQTSDEPTDFEQSSSDNIFEPSSDDESTEDVFTHSAYEQVESEAKELIQSLDFEGRRFLMKTSNGWMTMSDEQTHGKFSKMMTNLNSNKEWSGCVKVKPAKSAVKLKRKNWNDDDCKTFREYVTENDEDDMFMWGRTAKKLNRSELACKQQMRMILDCGFMAKRRRVS